jgi:hypothetical protein
MNTPRKLKDPRLGLRTSATFATIFVILGHTVFGFEQPLSAVLVALVTGYSCALFFEWVDSRANGIPPCYLGGGVGRFVDFLLSPHMTSITLSFLFYFNRRLWIMAFAVALAIGSKYVLRVRVDGKLRHFMNPSNFALAIVLAFYTWTGVLPWAYTINLHGVWDWLVPLIIVMLGMRLNLLFTGRLPTIGAWLATFVVLAFARSWYQHSPVLAELCSDWDTHGVVYPLHDHRSANLAVQFAKSDSLWIRDRRCLFCVADASRSIHHVLQCDCNLLHSWNVARMAQSARACL